MGLQGELGSARGTNESPLMKKGDGEANPYPSPVTQTHGCLPHRLGLWPLWSGCKWSEVQWELKGWDRAGGRMAEGDAA